MLRKFVVPPAITCAVTTAFFLTTISLAAAVPASYEIGSIPPLKVDQGSTLSVQLRAPTGSGGAFSYSIDPGYPTPKGLISLDSASGALSFTPTPDDKFEFRVTFTISGIGNSVQQPVVITPLTQLLPESDLIQHISHPDPASVDYLLVTESKNQAPELFNSTDGSQRNTRNIVISGKTVVFASNAPQQYGNLFTRFNYSGARGQNDDIKKLTICAETLTIRSPLKFPATDIVIYAAHLRFEDQAGIASIDTTPLPYLVGAAQFQNGAPGQNAGGVTLQIGDVYADPGLAARLISKGGIGQDAGQGRDGGPPPPPVISDSNYTRLTGGSINFDYVSASAFPVPYGEMNVRLGATTVPNPPPAIFEQHLECTKASSLPTPFGCRNPGGFGSIWGTQAWPIDGEDAKSPGKPGNAGAGAAIAASLDLRAMISQPGGVAGQPQQGRVGGIPQQPVTSASAVFYNIYCPDCIVNLPGGDVSYGGNIDFYWGLTIHTAVPGRNAPSKSADLPVGANGSFALLTGPSAQWLHPYILRHVIAHARDTYRDGNLQEAQGIFRTYLTALDNYGTVPLDVKLPFQQAHQEMEGLLLQVTNGIDYYGNGPGWVPLLSLEANMQGFQAEVKNTVPLLYLSLYLQNQAANNQKNINSLVDFMTKTNAEISTTAGDVNSALANLPTLQVQATQIAGQLTQLQSALQAREAYLKQKAKDNVEDSKKLPAWQAGLRILGTVAQLGSTVVPALAPIGAGINALASIDNLTPWTAIQGYSNAANDFLSFSSGDASTQIQTALKKLDSSKLPTDPKTIAQDLATAASSTAGFFQDQIKKNEAQQIPDSQVQAEYDKIRTQDGELNDLIQQVANLTAQEQAFKTAEEQAQQTISSGTSTIGRDLATIGSTNDNLNTAATQVDHAMIIFVKDMERAARDRLLRYQYFMAKAYEYRMLRPYPGDLNVDSVVNQILSQLGSQYPVDLSGVESLYLDSVRQIVFQGVTDYNSLPHDVSLPFIFELTDSELLQLNQNGSVSIDISDRIAGLPNEEDRHLVNLVVDLMSVQRTGNVSGPVANIRTIISHQGRSTETLNGHTYQFYFGTSPKDQPFVWGASFDLLSGQLNQETVGPDVSSFMRNQLGLSSSTDVSVLFARPGADAVITISKAPSPANLPAVISKLRLKAIVDFVRTTSSQVRLSVRTSNNNLPYIALSSPDSTGRVDGRGSFQRSYAAGSSISLLAEPIYQSLVFKDWIDTTGKILGTSSRLNLALNGSMSVLAEYVAVSSPNLNVPLRFIPTTPCRVVDTRGSAGPFGGPMLTGGVPRDFVFPNGACGIPSFAQAYALNATVVPNGSLEYLSLWPTGQPQPTVSTLNSYDGRVKANAAIVPAGVGGAISVFARNDSQLVLDINGYFVPAADPSALAFFPLTPCRVVDTRIPNGPLGQPGLSAGQSRDFPILLSSCGVPIDARAYSLNFTAVPKNTLSYLTVWPSGNAQPTVSTLNAPTGTVVANAAIIPAGRNGDISTFATDNTDLIIDINGFFAAPAGGGLSFYNLNPCRVLDTRNPTGTQPFSGTLQVNVPAAGCAVSSSAQAYVLNATVVPAGHLTYLSLWPDGQTLPVVSTLNAFDGAVTSNMAILPTNNLMIDAFASNPTHLIFDLVGYFAK